MALLTLLNASSSPIEGILRYTISVNDSLDITDEVALLEDSIVKLVSVGDDLNDWDENVVKALEGGSVLLLEVNVSDSLDNLSDALLKYCPGNIPAYIGSGSQTGNGTLAATYDVAVPALATAGNILIAQILGRNDNGDADVICNTSGWVAFPGNPYGSANNARQFLFYKISDGTEGGTNISFTATGGTTQDVFLGKIRHYGVSGGVLASNPIVGILSSTGTDGIVLPPNGVPTNVNQLAIAMSSGGSNSSLASFVGESNGDWTVNNEGLTSAGGDGFVNAQSSNQSSGATISGGASTFTVTVSLHWTCVVFLLVPASK